MASLSLQELSIVGSCVKTVWGSQQVGETLSSSQLSTLRWGEKEWTANVKCSCPCVFSLRAMNIISKIPLSFDLLLPRITQLYYSAFHNFWKLEPFINAGSGLVLKHVKSIWLKYIAFEGKRCVLKWFCFLANVVSIFFLFVCFGINGRPIIDFHFSLLAPISKQWSGTAVDDDNDKWIMFQWIVFLLQAGIGMV